MDGIKLPIEIKPASEREIRSMAEIRAQVWETEGFWQVRIRRYLNGEHSPQHALSPRTVLVAMIDEEVVGFVAGHLTLRFECNGELQWIDVARNHRRHGIAGALLVRIADWFVHQSAFRVCVNVASENSAALGLYAKYGAKPLNEGWLIWEDIRTAGMPQANAH
ncbi:MAG: GNAT family N-acetyltransferase [Terracidiphilus sp.]